MDCSNCDKFKAYEYSESVRFPDNCVTFMVNNGGCPRKEEILNNAKPVCSIPKINDCENYIVFKKMDRVWEERSTPLSLEKAREFIKVEKEYFPNSVCHIFLKVE